MINLVEKGQSLKNMESSILHELGSKKLWGDMGLSEDEYEILRDRIKEILRYHGVTIVQQQKVLIAVRVIVYRIGIYIFKDLLNWSIYRIG